MLAERLRRDAVIPTLIDRIKAMFVEEAGAGAIPG
jgi:hypothetical protein